MLNPFYTKKIDIYNYGSYVDDNGITRSGYTLASSNVKCDIQPISAEKVEKVYGYDLSITKQIFLELEPEVLESSVIRFNEKDYKIEKLIEWDSYLQLGVSEK